MIELILIYFLAGKIRQTADSKGQSKLRWTFRLIFSWIMGEFIFLLFGFSILGFDPMEGFHLLLMATIGLAGGLLGYYLTKMALDEYPELPPEAPEEPKKDLSYFR